MHSHIVTIVAEIMGSSSKVEPLYLDPGSGSMLIQLIVAGVLGAALVLKTSWGRIKKFFDKNTSEASEDEVTNHEDE